VRNLQRLKLRRAAGLFGGISLVLLSIYLRCFVFLKISPGAILVYGSFLGGAMLLEGARKSNRAIKTESISD